MIDKIKVNLSYFVYSTLLEDMSSFEYFKKNGEINKNHFLNTIIINFYYEKLLKREAIIKKLTDEAILSDISKKNKDKMLLAATKIMDDYYNEDMNYNYRQFNFMIYPTKNTQNFFDDIYENEIKNNVSISSFMRRLLNEYASLPKYIREHIAKNVEMNRLNDACETSNIVIFRISIQLYKVAPFKVISNFESTHFYLIGIDLSSKELKPISMKICKIHDVVVSKEVYTLSKEEQNKLTNIIMSGVEYASGELLRVRIKLSKTGIKLLNIKLYNRPIIEQINEDTYEIRCSMAKFFNYFMQFGKEFTILNNDELKQKFYNFFSVAAKHHDK